MLETENAKLGLKFSPKDLWLEVFMLAAVGEYRISSTQ